MGLSNFRSVRRKDGSYALWFATLAGANGVYIIRSRARRRKASLILYVGESHTHRLRETLQRHFQTWNGATAGPTFDGADCEVAVQVFLSGEKAIERQDQLIRRLRPIHNVQIPTPAPKRPRKGRSPRSEGDAYDELASFFEAVTL